MWPERCWPLAVGVFRWTGMPRGGRVGGPELRRRRGVVLLGQHRDPPRALGVSRPQGFDEPVTDHAVADNHDVP